MIVKSILTRYHPPTHTHTSESRIGIRNIDSLIDRSIDIGPCTLWAATQFSFDWAKKDKMRSDLTIQSSSGFLSVQSIIYIYIKMY